jgi:hypothetical protein
LSGSIGTEDFLQNPMVMGLGDRIKGAETGKID